MKKPQRLIFLMLGIIVFATASATAAGNDLAQIAASRPLSRDRVALAEAFGRGVNLPRVARTAPLAVKLGDTQKFWVSDPSSTQNRQIEARLRYIGKHILMYVDTTLSPDQALVERSARRFEEQIYPRNRALFGNEPAPGIDGDLRLTVLNTLIRGAGGYFSPDDAVVRAVNRFSNERDMFVIDLGSYPLGSDGYASTLAHEFQHMIHTANGPGTAIWFDEGLSSLAEDLNGYVNMSQPQLFLSSPDLALINWQYAGAHYGMARLFLRYIHDQYAGDANLKTLVQQDAGRNLGAFVKLAAARRPDIRTFEDLFADWAVATLLNDAKLDDGRYAYKLYAGPPTRTPAVNVGATARSTVAQYGLDYIELNGPLTLDFDGADSVSLTGAAPVDGRYAWWSNRGDQQVATLTRAVDLRKARRATLQFKARYEIERGYDYAFVSLSIDAGKTWQTLTSTSTTSEDPRGSNYGQGFTGVSGIPNADINTGQRGRWVDEQADLTPYAGKQVLIRFWSISDAALSGSGLMIDDLRIPEIGLRDGFEQGEAGWLSQGFVRVSGELPQHWTLRLVRYGRTTRVEPIQTDSRGRSSIQIARGERAVLIISGTTLYTSEPAEYTYRVR